MAETIAILDTRPANEFLQAHPAGAVNIPADELPFRMHELPEKGAILELLQPSGSNVRDLLQSRGYQVRECVAGLTETGPSRARLWCPSPLLHEALEHHPTPGEAIDVGCGSGREAVYLAALGWQVIAMDHLPDALEKAADLARRNAVTIRCELGDAGEWRPRPESYDMVCFFRFVEAAAITRAAETLRPGGLLVIESFHPEDVRPGEKRDKTKLVTTGTLKELCHGLQVVIGRDAVERNGRRFTQFVGQRQS